MLCGVSGKFFALIIVHCLVQCNYRVSSLTFNPTVWQSSIAHCSKVPSAIYVIRKVIDFLLVLTLVRVITRSSNSEYLEG